MATATPQPGEVLDDLSAYVIGGRVSLVGDDGGHESDCRTPAQGILDGIEAEQIGFRRVFLSERWNLKEAGVILRDRCADPAHRYRVRHHHHPGATPVAYGRDGCDVSGRIRATVGSGPRPR